MEILTSSLISKPHFSSSISPSSSLTSLTKKTPYKFRKTLLKSFPKPPFSTTSPLKTSHISAHFGRPSKRRNSLRKKLTNGSNSKVRENPQKVDEFVDNQINDSTLSSTVLENGIKEVGISQIDLKDINLDNSSKQFGEKSVLWDKLEGWVEQYKKDIELWGIGSNPIFTINHDLDGKVEQVLVDKNEILKRSGVDPLYFDEESELKGVFYDVVRSKIEHAKLLADELRSGKKNVIPRNSSVAKFVVSGESSSGVVSWVRSVSVPRISVEKVWWVGVAVVCGVVGVAVVRKLFALGGKEVEMTGFEREMLRRKREARMAKERLRKGSVEVVEEVVNPSVLVAERPVLDKEGVLKSIREAKGLNNSIVMVDAGDAQEVEATVMDTKIREIQMMARHAREVERGEGSSSEGDELDEEIVEDMQGKEAVEGLENSTWTDELEKQASNVLPLTVQIAAESPAVDEMNLMNNLSSEKSAETRVLNGSLEAKALDNLKTDATFTGEKVSEGNEDAELHSTSSERIIDDKKNHDVSDSVNLTEGIKPCISKSQVNPPKRTTARRKPKIIRSVNEAREYLMQKHDHKLEIGDVPATAAAKDEGLSNYHSQRLGEADKASDSFDVDKLVDRVPAPKVSKRNEFLGSHSDGLKVEIESGLEQKTSFDLQSTDNSGITTPNLAKKMKNDDMLKPSESHERSVPMAGEKICCDTSQETTKPILTEQCLEKAEKSDETPMFTKITDNVSGRSISDNVSSGNISHHAINSTEGLGVPDDDSLHDANLLKKVDLPNDNDSVKVNGTNEPSIPMELNDLSVPTAVGRDVNGSAAEENRLLPIEIKDKDSYAKNDVESKPLGGEIFQGSGSDVKDKEGLLFADEEKWLEKNFHEVEPILQKIGSGFSNNYSVAREKTKQEDAEIDLMSLGSIKDGTELEWMQDDKLREIVFKVRDNELAGRDPFHSMDPEDKVAFFEGLEKKVEIENQKLSFLHEWLHSNIENIDYGADGISIYDPPEKIKPRWKGPPLDKIPEFLNNISHQQQVESSLQKVDKSQSTKPDITEASQKGFIPKSAPREKDSKSSKTVIETSDGSIKPGKKTGKEFWQHTKKWSRGFVESYNAETDPEVKSTMKDIGKDLDRWITEKEIQDAADMMDKIPQQGKEYVEKKLNKLKREMELFGPQAVVSKYREYAEVKEEDYLWWLDLPHVLCIEMYTYEGEDQRVGFYSLEMGGDLEIEPKPHHVIAFEDPGDCKNFCYIIQAHLEMLGLGKAFIVPQPPKDVFWQAKENGFGVTVIRKGEIKLNVDQALEEVEDLITEIGSKMYHDKIMRERSVDISSLMKGVFGVSPPSKRKRKKRARKRPSKS